MKTKKSVSEKTVDIVIFLIMCLVIIITLYPFLYVLSMSISKNSLATVGRFGLFPKAVSVEAYFTIFKDPQIWTSYYNTVWYAGVGTSINIVMTMMGAFVLAQRRFFLRRPIMIFIIITMYFSGGLIPEYILINKLGLYNTRWAIVIPSAVSAFYLIIARTFIESNVPDSMYESARIEGANDWTILFRIVVPLSKPIIAVLMLYYGVGYWNSYFEAMIYLPSQKLQPLQLYLINIVIKNSSGMLEEASAGIERSLMMMQIKYAVIVVAMLPVLCVYPLIQKYFVKGVLIGAVKE